MNLGLAVKTLRKNKGLTQGNFCEMVGITQSYLSQVENGNKEPSIDVVKKIADALGTPMPVLFWFTLTEEDVDESKVEVFKLLKPSVDSLVDAFFN
jgi:transcriptional regulator with XRE-family HTH domain